MGVYIKGMNMPKDFFRCPFAVILNAINSSGRMGYGDYCELYDAISDIYGTTGGAV